MMDLEKEITKIIKGEILKEEVIDSLMTSALKVLILKDFMKENSEIFFNEGDDADTQINLFLNEFNRKYEEDKASEDKELMNIISDVRFSLFHATQNISIIGIPF